MPSATRSGPITSAQANDQTHASQPTTTETSGYNTRKKAYKYSHTRAPYIPPPTRPTKRLPPPVSVATKRQRVDKESTDEGGNANPSVGEDGELGAQSNDNASALQQIIGDQHDSPFSGPSTLGVEAPEPEPNSTGPLDGSLADQSLETESQQVVAQSQQTSTNHSLTENYAPTRQDITTSLTQTIGSSSSNLHFTTPRRPTQAVELTPSAVVIFHTPPTWARFNAHMQSEVTAFSPSSATLFSRSSARIEDVDINDPTPERLIPSSDHQDSASYPGPPVDGSIDVSLDSFPGTQNSHPTPDYHSSTHNSQATIAVNVPTHSTPHVQSTALVVHSPVSDFSRMYNTIRQSLPSTLRNSDLGVALVRTPHQHGSPSSHVGSVAGSSIAPRSRNISTARAGSLAFDDWSSREGSTSRDTPAPTTITSRSHTQPSSNANHLPQRALRQRDFTYEQVSFMNAMRKRWHWYLVAENLFPVNTSHALELCMQYAEQTLEVSRVSCRVGHTALEFVRRKDSSIRSLLQTGLLSIIEDSYDVTTSSSGKLTELISQSNYIYAEYDIETKKVSGRYRHPCLMRVLAAILFAKRIRGRPIGVCFMSSVMGGDEPQQPKGNRVTPSMIALACTLVLYGLQSIKAGDSSERLGSRKGKPVNFTEKRYSTHYRNFVTKIRDYNRLEEVRKAYLEEMMREYLQVRVDEMEDSDAHIEADDEMHSDGD